MINFDALHNERKPSYTLLKKHQTLSYGKLCHTMNRHIMPSSKTINADNSITIIKDKLRMAIRTFKKIEKEQKQMELTLKNAKKYLKAYKRAYKMILKMYRWYIIPLKNPLEEKIIHRRTTCILH